MLTIWHDLRYASRILLKTPGFTIAALVVLALGIGANSAIFSVVNTVLLRPLPFAEPDGLVQIYHVPPAQGFPGIKRFAVSAANYLDWRAMAKSFNGMAAYGPGQFTLSGLDRPESVRGARVGGDFFAILRAQPVLGRFITDDDDQPGHQVAVISSGFWKSHFAGAPDVVGKTIVLDGDRYSIIGVAPPALSFPAWYPTGGEIWVPLGWNSETRAVRKDHNLRVVARLQPGVSLQQAQAEMNTISSQLANQYPDANRDWGAVVTSLRDDVVGDIRPVLLVLLGAVAFVLLIACANVANLITARNLARKKEIAIRAALGAGRGRTLQQLLCESLLLSVAGGLVGLGIASIAMPLLVTFIKQEFDVGGEIPLDSSVLLFTLAISILTGVVAGALPAWRGSRIDLNDALKQGLGRTSSDSGTRRTRTALVAAEVALSLMLLAGAGLMIRSLWILTGVNPGFDPKNVLTLTVGVSTKDPTAVNALYDRVLQRVRELPGVDSAGMVGGLPLRGGSNQPFTIEGKPAAPFAQQPNVSVRSITPGYLRSMRIPLLRGRDITDSDIAGRKRVVLISDSMAKRFWPGEDPIGQHVRLSFFPEETREVVGIVGDVKQNELDFAEVTSSLYQAEKQATLSPLSLTVRTKTAPETMASSITQVVQELTPDQPVRNVRTMQSIVDESIANRRMSMFMLAAFAGLALLLAAFGLYSVLAYTIRRRVREIGIRMALGASASDVLRIVAVETFRPTAAGIVAGLAGSLMLSSLLTKLLYGIRPTDPGTFVVVAVTLAFVSVLAGVVPAWRATRVDPIQVLREE